MDFNPLRPCGRRLQRDNPYYNARVFQSTPPVWAETVQIHFFRQNSIISIHSARVGGDKGGLLDTESIHISIHSARVGGELPICFYPVNDRLISIHSARVGGDLRYNIDKIRDRRFQSTPPVWAETRRYA